MAAPLSSVENWYFQYTKRKQENLIHVNDINVYTYIDRGVISVVPITGLALLALLLQCWFCKW